MIKINQKVKIKFKQADYLMNRYRYTYHKTIGIVLRFEANNICEVLTHDGHTIKIATKYLRVVEEEN